MEKILIVAFIVLAIWYSFQEGEIFGFVSHYGERLPEKWQQPLFGCNVCMSYWYGSAVYWIFWGNSWQEWIITVVGAMGANAAINKLSPDK